MPRKTTLCILLALVVGTPSIHGDNLPSLTNDNILQMLKGGLSDAQITAVIQKNDANFELTSTAIKALRQSGVSENVFTAMWSANLRSSKNAATAAAAPAAASPPPAATAPPPVKYAAAAAPPLAPPPAPPAPAAAPAPAATGCSQSATPVSPNCPAPTLSLSTDSAGKTTYTGTLANGKSKAVRICVDDVETLKSVPVSNGTFSGGTNTLDAKAGSVIVAQAAACGADGTQYGPLSIERSIGKCSAVLNGDLSVKATLDPIDVGSVFVSGTTNQKGGRVRLCVGDAQDAIATVDADGNFVAKLSSQVTAGQSVSVQPITSDAGSAAGAFPRNYGMSTTVTANYAYNGFVAAFVGGIEQGGYSSQASNTNGFLSAFFRSPFWGRSVAPSIWGRIRLLSGPLPSTVNVVAAITNPNGTITSSNLASVGQVVDYVFGPEIRLKQWGSGEIDRISFVAGIGATTPLTSNQIQYSFQAPPANSQQCIQLAAKYPTFLPNGSTAPACKLINSVTNEAIGTIAFAAEDRTDFLVKYGGGFRFTHIYPAKGTQPQYSGTLDLLVGQDQSTTGGKFHGVVFRIDGVYPLALGASSYLYLFGSASMKSTNNITSNPIVLSPTQSPSLPLATTVALLPLRQPDRDFYRFGVGLNIKAIFAKLAGTTGTTNPTANGQGGAPTSSGGTNASNAATQAALTAKY